MKLVSLGIDPDYIGFTADHVTAELFGVYISDILGNNL